MGYATIVQVVCCLLLAGSATAQPYDNPVLINTQGSYGASEVSFDIEGKVNKAILDAFHERFPHIRLEGGSLPLMIEGLGTESSLLLAIAGGTAPDVIEFNFRQSGTYVEKGFLYPLDEWIQAEMSSEEARKIGVYDENIMYSDELSQRVLPKAMDALYTTGRDGQKHFYFLPFYNEVRVLAYNKVLFRDAGLDPIDDVPKTWDELWEVGKRLTDPERNIYGFMNYRSDYLSWASAPLFLSMNTERVVRDRESGQWRAAFNGPGITEAADFWIKLVSGKWRHPGSGKMIEGIGEFGADVWVKWYRDEVGMVLLTANDILMNSNFWVNARSYDEIGLAAIPAAPNGKSVSELYLRFKGITATSEDPAVRDAVWKYIRFIGSDAAREIAVDTYVENNYGRFIMPELLEKYGYQEYLDEVPQEWAEAIRYSFANSEPEPFGKNTQHVYPMMSVPVQKALYENLGDHPDKEYRLARLQEYYDSAVVTANEKMMEIVPEDEVGWRSIVSFVIATLIFLMFLFLFIYIWRVFTPEYEGASHRSQFKKFKLAYLLLAPAALGVVIFNYYPLARGAVMAFQDYNVMDGSEYIGLTNFSLVFFDTEFWLAIVVSAYYTLLFLVMVFVPPIVLAILLSEIPAGKIFFRVLFYLPAVISGIVMMLMWKNFFNPTPDGFLNQIVALAGLDPIRWLDEKSTAMISIMLPQAWAGMGPGCLIYLAALKTVPDDLYESASLDGGGFFDRIRYVAIPVIRPLILIQLIFALIAAFQASDAVLVMTAGGPDDATMVVGLQIFFNAFMYQRFGVATAMAWILGFILMGFTVFQMRRLSRMTFTTAS